MAQILRVKQNCCDPLRDAKQMTVIFDDDTEIAIPHVCCTCGSAHDFVISRDVGSREIKVVINSNPIITQAVYDKVKGKAIKLQADGSYLLRGWNAVFDELDADTEW